jgi:uncharacterized protein with HEPN domain
VSEEPDRIPVEAAEGRFEPKARSDSGSSPTDPEEKREERLAATLAQLSVCLNDASELVAMGRQRFDEEWLTRRAARNIVTEFAEASGRLPERFTRQHPDVPWRAINGMRNRVVHVYENTDPEIVWNVLAGEFPDIGRQLNLRQ